MPDIEVDGGRHRGRSGRAARLLAWATLSVALGTGLGGCESVFRDSADHDAYALLRTREQQVLGETVEDEISPGEVPTRVPGAAYQKVPATETQLPPGYQPEQAAASQPTSGATTAPATAPATMPGGGAIGSRSSSVATTLPSVSRAIKPPTPKGQAAPTGSTSPTGPATMVPANAAAAEASASAAVTPQDMSPSATAPRSAETGAASAPGSDESAASQPGGAMSDTVDTLVQSMPQINLTKMPPLPEFPPPLPLGQKRQVFALEDCFDYALGHSRDYRSQKETLYLVALNVLLERHQFEPQPFATTTAQLGRAMTGEANDYSVAMTATQTLGVRQRLPYGGEVTAQALVGLVDQMRSQYSSGVIGQSAGYSLSANVPLLRGAGMVAQESLIQSERDMVYAVRSFALYRRNFLVAIASSYFNLVNQRAQVRNAYRSVTSYSFITARTQALFSAGRPPTTLLDVQRAMQLEYSARNNLINTVASFGLAVDNFKLLLGMPVEENLDIAAQYLNVAPPDVPERQAIAIAERLRLDLQTVSDPVDDARRGVAVASNNLLPDLNLSASANVPSDPARSRVAPVIDQTDLLAGITLNWPLDRLKERNDYRAALIALQRAMRSKDQAEDQMMVDVRSSLRKVRQQVFLLALQKNNIDLASKRKEFAEIQYRNGLVDNRDFLDAETALLDAQNSFAAALANLQVAILQYLRDTGQMRVDPHGKLILPATAVVAPGGEAAPPVQPTGVTPPPPMTQPLPVNPGG